MSLLVFLKYFIIVPRAFPNSTKTLLESKLNRFECWSNLSGETAKRCWFELILFKDVHTMWIENCVKKNSCKTSKTSWTETRNLVFYESDCAGLRCIVHGLNNPFVFWEQRRWGVWGSWCCNTAPSMLHIGTQCLFFLRYLRRSFLLPPKKL